MVSAPAWLPRNEGNQRLYSIVELKRLNFIKHARDLGFSMQDIRELISLQNSSESKCENAHQIIKSQLEAVQRKIKRLNKLELELKRIYSLQDTGLKDSCKVIETLSDHSKCLGEH